MKWIYCDFVPYTRLISPFHATCMLNSCSRNSYEEPGDQGGFFDLVVKPMLQKGHEGELCSWLKDSSLLCASMSCDAAKCNGRTMVWSPARIIDKYNWMCSDCNSKKSIRENSFFLKIKCNFKICLQVILAWCQGAYMENVVNCLGTFSILDVFLSVGL